MKRTVSVEGSASVSVEPDCARLTCGVQVVGVDAQDALRRSNEALDAIVAALGASGVASADLRTMGPNLYSTDKGYAGSNDVVVLVRDVGSVGDVIDAVAAAGGPNFTMRGLTFSSLDPAAHLSLARAAAVESAHAIATELAAASGAAVAEVLTIVETTGSSMPVPAGRVMAMASTPVESGTLDLRVDVSVTYRLVDAG